MEFFQKLEGRAPEDREKALHEYRPKVHEKLAKFLKATLKPDQLKRFRQLELQLEGAFALGQPEVGKELKITNQQRMRFMAVVQDLQKKIEPLIKEAHAGGNPEEIRPKVMHIRKEHEAKIEAILTDAQKKQWKEMLGERFTLDDYPTPLAAGQRQPDKPHDLARIAGVSSPEQIHAAPPRPLLLLTLPRAARCASPSPTSSSS